MLLNIQLNTCNRLSISRGPNRSMTRVLSIGPNDNIEFLDSIVDWNETNNVNIKDFEIVYCDLRSIEQPDNRYMAPMSNDSRAISFPDSGDILQLLRTGGDIIVVLPRNRSIELYGQDEKRDVDIFGWLPIKIKIVEEYGESLDTESVESSWEWYFNQGFEWDMYIEPKLTSRKEELISGIEKELNDRFSGGPSVISTMTPPSVSPFAFIRSLATNRYDKAIASEAVFRSIDEYPEDESDLWDGSIYFIPLKPGIRYEEFVRQTLANVYPDAEIETGSDQIPEWLNDYTLPEERDILEKIDKLRSQLEGMQQFKELLYERGTPLENAVHAAFRKVGFQVKPEVSHGEDGAIELEESRIMLEVYGTTSGISISKASQLDDWVDEELMSGPEKHITGLLVANPHCDEDPENRDIHPNNVIEYLNSRGYKLMTTIEVFRMVKAFKNNDLTKSEIQDKLTSEETVIDFDNISIRD